MSELPPRTLIISPNWIGDAVMAQPLLHRLQERFPGRAIDVLAPSWVAPVWKAMPEVHDVIETPFRHGALQLGERWKLARTLKQKGYVDAYILPNTFKFALIPWMAGIPRRIGYKGEMRYGLINVMHHDDPVSPRPMVGFYAALAEPPTRKLPSWALLSKPRMSVSDKQIEEAMSRLNLRFDGPPIVFAPGAEFGSAKRWPAAYFAELARMLHSAYPGIGVLLLGSQKDKAVCEEIVAAAPGVHNLAGATRLNEAIALIAKAGAVVSNDSGLMHVASALQRPIVAIYGPTDPRHTPPLSDVARVLWLHIDCSPCHQRECPLLHHNCMKNIPPDMVLQPLKEMLGAGRE
jgi:heptosyltransferase-2